MSARDFHVLVAKRDEDSDCDAYRWCLAHAYTGIKLLPERTLLGNKVSKESTLRMIPRYGSTTWWPLDPTGVIAKRKTQVRAI